MILTLRFHAACCTAVAVSASGVKSGIVGRGEIVTTAGKLSICSATVVLPGKAAHTVSDNKNPSRPC